MNSWDIYTLHLSLFFPEVECIQLGGELVIDFVLNVS
jgi:hypothetical protein